jgi:hypothetical protein
VTAKRKDSSFPPTFSNVRFDLSDVKYDTSLSVNSGHK